MSPTLAIKSEPRIFELLPSLDLVVVTTDDQDERLAATRRAATQLAAQHGWRIVLYDRSAERWTDTPHPSMVLGTEDLPSSSHEHLRHQMNDIARAGVPVSAWIATVPSITAMLDALQELRPDAVILPSELGRPTLADRVMVGDSPAESVERVTDLQLGDSPIFFEIDDDMILTARSHPEDLS